MADRDSEPARLVAVPANTASASTPAAATPVTLTPTIRTMIVCVPDDLSTEVLQSSRRLDRHFGVTATSQPHFWASPRLRLWQRADLIHPHRVAWTAPGPRYCAGGPVRLLDLTGMRHGAAFGAGLRFQLWTRVVHGTKAATAWPVYVQRHLDNPAKYPMDKATADFRSQPRVQAMRLHNAAAAPAGELDPHELELYQAGHAAYTNYHSMWAICADALLTEAGHKIQPASDHLTDQVTYLGAALRHVETLDRDQRILAITL